METLGIALAALVGIALATGLSPRVGIASPLILVGFGAAASLLPFIPYIYVDPQIILIGVLPPLLYAVGVSIPATDVRREIKAIGGLSIALVVLTTLALGPVFYYLIPNLSWPWAFALGAIVSPTDAVATSIVRRLGVSRRVVSLLEGESLLNDATALVLLRGMVAATAASVTIWGLALEFVLAFVGAVIIGWLVARVNLWLSARMPDAVSATIISFTVPFAASLPAELVGASGLVAAVVAGVVTGNGAPKKLSPQARQTIVQTWRAIELVLEGIVYLFLGLQVLDVIQDVQARHAGVWYAIGVAAAAVLVAMLVRAAFMGPLLWSQNHRARRAERLQPKVQGLRSELDEPGPDTGVIRAMRRHRRLRRIAASPERVRQRLARAEADLTYLASDRLGAREGGVMLWAGMRGVVTVAAAQSLPIDTPSRSLLIFVAYAVAVGSLVVQGGTVHWVVNWLKPSPGATAEEQASERVDLRVYLDDAAEHARALQRHQGRDPKERAQRVEVVKARRDALLQARDLGLFSSGALAHALDELDAEQIRLELW